MAFTHFEKQNTVSKKRGNFDLAVYFGLAVLMSSFQPKDVHYWTLAFQAPTL